MFTFCFNITVLTLCELCSFTNMVSKKFIEANELFSDTEFKAASYVQQYLLSSNVDSAELSDPEAAAAPTSCNRLRKKKRLNDFEYSDSEDEQRKKQKKELERPPPVNFIHLDSMNDITNTGNENKEDQSTRARQLLTVTTPVSTPTHAHCSKESISTNLGIVNIS